MPQNFMFFVTGFHSMKISILHSKQEETTIFLELEHSGRTLVSAIRKLTT